MARSNPPGDEPDYRFTLANERTFLAWIRTSFALVFATTSYRHWVHVDQAIRSQRPLPKAWMPLSLAVTVGAAILLTFVLIILGWR